MFACLHGTGNLAAVAFDFSPLVERTAADTVTCDVAGLDRLFGAARNWPLPSLAAPPKPACRRPSRWPPILTPPSAPRADFRA